MRDYDEYHDDGVRLHTPVLQRVLILAAVIIIVPVVMWTITAFVRSYVARPKVPVVQHLASSESPTARVGSPAVIPAAPAADQGAPVPQRADAKPPPPAAASATAPAPPPANVSPPAVQPASIQPPAPAPSAPAPVPRRAAAGADIAAPAPAPPLRTADSAPAASDRGQCAGSFRSRPALAKSQFEQSAELWLRRSSSRTGVAASHGGARGPARHRCDPWPDSAAAASTRHPGDSGERGDERRDDRKHGRQAERAGTATASPSSRCAYRIPIARQSQRL
jgi:outer membrane biosynthesis protein TonB